MNIIGREETALTIEVCCIGKIRLQKMGNKEWNAANTLVKKIVSCFKKKKQQGWRKTYSWHSVLIVWEAITAFTVDLM